MKLNHKWHRPIIVTISVFVFSCIISLGMVAINLGFSPNFLSIWLKSWLTAFIVAYPTIWFCQPLIVKLVNKIEFTH